MQSLAQMLCAALQELAAALEAWFIIHFWLQGQGEQDGGLAHALNTGFNPAGSVDAHLQQQQLLQQRQLSAHSTTSELQLEGRQLSGQKPGELLLDQGGEWWWTPVNLKACVPPAWELCEFFLRGKRRHAAELSGPIKLLE